MHFHVPVTANQLGVEGSEVVAQALVKVPKLTLLDLTGELGVRDGEGGGDVV